MDQNFNDLLTKEIEELDGIYKGFRLKLLDIKSNFDSEKVSILKQIDDEKIADILKKINN